MVAGNPCTAQIKSTSSPVTIIFFNVSIPVSFTLGATPVIGSQIKVDLKFLLELNRGKDEQFEIYLYSGAGNPCAAHINGTVCSVKTKLFKPVIDLSFAVGATLVCGSIT